MTVLFKICGLKDSHAVRATIDSGASFAGFVYYPASPRHIEVSDAVSLCAMLPASTASVCVCVDPDDSFLRTVQQAKCFHYIQLHGHESVHRVKQIRSMLPDLKIIKSISVRQSDDVAKAHAYCDIVDLLLFDAKAPDTHHMLPGGNGLAFDWVLLKNQQFSKPWMLSGGLHQNNIATATDATGAIMIDVSSGVEASPGVKDAALIVEFGKAVRAL